MKGDEVAKIAKDGGQIARPYLKSRVSIAVVQF